MRGSEKTDGTDSCASKLMPAYHFTDEAQDFFDEWPTDLGEPHRRP
jgi:hypothetical protein